MSEGADPADKILYTTGRLTSEMVIKTALMGIPVLASRSGFTAWGVEIARQVGLTLIGRMRGQRFVCLSGEDRLVRDADAASMPDEDRKHSPQGRAGMKAPLGVILAGGQATRMGGGDKGLKPLGDRTILGHVIDRLSPQVAGLALNANGNPSRFADLGLPVIPDSIEDFAGPLAGVLAGLDWAAREGADTIVTAAADTPFFPPDLVPRLILATEGMEHPLALAASPEGRHPTFGLWPVALRDDLRAALEGGLRKVVVWTDRHGGRLAEFPGGDPDPFFNVNTPEDLALAERWS